MGGSQSKSEVNQLSKSISTIASNSVVNCQTNINQDQKVEIINNGFKLFSSTSMKQASTIDVKCVQNSQFQSKLQTDIINAISNATTTNGIAMLDAFSKAGSDAKTTLSTIVENSVTINNIMSIYNEVSQNQDLKKVNNFIELIENVDMVQGSEIFAAATLQSISDAGIFNTIESHLDQSSSTTMKNPLDFVVDIYKSTTQSLLYGLIAVVIGVCIIGAALVIMGGKVMTDPNAAQNIAAVGTAVSSARGPGGLKK